MTNLDDTTRCPAKVACEGCGSDHGLQVVTVETIVGVYCVTLCAADRIRPPGSTSAPEAAHRVLDHCEHLDIDVDEMARLMADDDGEADGT